MKRIIIETDKERHNKIKSYASSKGMTIKDFILKLIDKEIDGNVK